MKKLILILTISLCNCCQNQTSHNELNEIAVELNKQCPRMLDEGTRFDKVSSSSNNVLDLTFTLINLEKETTDIKGLENEVKVFLQDHLEKGFGITETTNIDLEFLRQNKVSFHYIYLDKKGQTLVNIFIKPEDYL